MMCIDRIYKSISLVERGVMTQVQLDRLDQIEELLAKMSANLAAEQYSRLELRADLKTLTDAVKRNSEAISQITQRVDHILHVFRV